jgi:hypothetical protein
MMLRCRLKAAFHVRAERRLQAAGWALEETCRAPVAFLEGSLGLTEGTETSTLRK